VTSVISALVQNRLNTVRKHWAHPEQLSVSATTTDGASMLADRIASECGWNSDEAGAYSNLPSRPIVERSDLLDSSEVSPFAALAILSASIDAPSVVVADTDNCSGAPNAFRTVFNRF